MLEAGVVTEVRADQASVRMTRNAACAECGLCHQLAHPGHDLVLSAANLAGARPGDLVRVQLPDLGVVQAAFWAYGIPTIAAAAGAILGWVVGGRLGGQAELGATAGMIVALVLGFVAVNRYDRRLRSRWRGPAIVEILDSRTGGGDEIHLHPGPSTPDAQRLSR
ncbi:MAG: SoxR reducing system RseC family protein [Bacillota bacterium]|nr:SoxR reducing system RseC family protein [Bacillota bacterium]